MKFHFPADKAQPLTICIVFFSLSLPYGLIINCKK
jgi:hypothetical protein